MSVTFIDSLFFRTIVLHFINAFYFAFKDDNQKQYIIIFYRLFHSLKSAIDNKCQNNLFLKVKV